MHMLLTIFFLILLTLPNYLIIAKSYSIFCQPEIYRQPNQYKNMVKKNDEILHADICDYSQYLQHLLNDITNLKVTDVIGPTKYQDYGLCYWIDRLI